VYISHVEIANFRALEAVSVPLNQFSVLLGENDVGKTSFLCALEKYFSGKKLTEAADWFKEDISREIRIVLTFQDIPESDELAGFIRENGSIILSKVFALGTAPNIKAILDDNSAISVSALVIRKWFSQECFHFIPVRRDLSVQFSMAKTALLGKTLRAKMKKTLDEGGGLDSLTSLEHTLISSLDEPKKELQKYLREQMHNNSVKLEFDGLEIDPIDGVSFKVKLSDDRVENIPIENRGAGTQNSLIIALFRLIAELKLDGYFILAMEEPENSLHPKAQRQLLSVIQEISTGSQVIVTTHSPVFIDRSKFENNIILTRTSNGNTLAKTFDSTQLSQIRTDLGIRASDALLKGGGNCAILVEGSTEEDGFPIFMEMLGMSEFKLGIAIIPLGGSDLQKTRNTAQLLKAYDIPCVIVLDADAQKCADDLRREKEASLTNIKEVICLSKGTIEDYYPLEIVADVINQELQPTTSVSAYDFDSSLHGQQRLKNFKKVMYEHGAGDSIEYLKRLLGNIGSKLLQERQVELDDELKEIFFTVKSIVEEQ
jgi:putative ATP-dependent endonuclease of the OLD family